MSWQYLALIALGCLALTALLCFGLVRFLGKREPYAGFLSLDTRGKLTFFRLLLQSNQVPLYVKLLPVVAVIYFVSPIDLLTGIPIDDLAIALLALLLVIKFTPAPVLANLLVQAAESSAAKRDEKSGAKDRARLPFISWLRIGPLK